MSFASPLTFTPKKENSSENPVYAYSWLDNYAAATAGENEQVAGVVQVVADLLAERGGAGDREVQLRCRAAPEQREVQQEHRPQGQEAGQAEEALPEHQLRSGLQQGKTPSLSQALFEGFSNPRCRKMSFCRPKSRRLSFVRKYFANVLCR